MKENLEIKQAMIEYCRNLKRDIKRSEESKRPISIQIESELRRICHISIMEDIEKYPQLKAVIDEQKTKETNGLKLWKRELKKVMKANNLTEKDIEEEEI